jgi:pyridoxamine-phosphate oxidase
MAATPSEHGPDARPGNPLELVADWYGEAVAAGLPEPSAMALATATPDGAPSVRFLLLKGIDEHGVQFFTNYESRKGRELAENPRAALAMFWQPLQRQVRMEGRVEVLDDAESDAYFATRARGSRIGAWASMQGRAIPDREWLEARVAETSRGRRTGAATGSCPRRSSSGRGARTACTSAGTSCAAPTAAGARNCCRPEGVHGRFT